MVIQLRPEVLSKDRNIIPDKKTWIETNATSRQNIACLGSSLSTKPLHSFSQFLPPWLLTTAVYLPSMHLNVTSRSRDAMNASSSKLLAWTQMSPHQSLVVKYQPIGCNQKTTWHNIGTARSQHEVQKTFQASYQVLPEQISDKFGPFHIICSHWKPSCTIRAGESLSRSYFRMHWRHKCCT